jgi:hypothetical protein
MFFFWIKYEFCTLLLLFTYFFLIAAFRIFSVFNCIFYQIYLHIYVHILMFLLHINHSPSDDCSYSGTVCCIMRSAVRQFAVLPFAINCSTQSALWLQILSRRKKQISATVQVSVCTQLHLTSSPILHNKQICKDYQQIIICVAIWGFISLGR